jgi:ORF6N domain
MSTSSLLPLETITHRILLVRGQKVLLDADLAALYGVETRRLNEQVRRNRDRFPEDFIFRLTTKEVEALNRSQIATGSQKHRDPRYTPFAFTEHGAIMAATILKSPRAVEMSVYVVRAFVRLREVLASNVELAKRLDDLEQATEALAMQHDTFARNTRAQLKQVFDAIRELMTPPVPQKKRPIGFISGDEKPKKN